MPSMMRLANLGKANHNLLFVFHSLLLLSITRPDGVIILPTKAMTSSLEACSFMPILPSPENVILSFSIFTTRCRMCFPL